MFQRLSFKIYCLRWAKDDNIVFNLRISCIFIFVCRIYQEHSLSRFYSILLNLRKIDVAQILHLKVRAMEIVFPSSHH